ncbi:hypothetical protein [Streptomyces sp. NP-1717]|uniref:hypothetical protein n=1 Tax=Streptomyces sp. NP-1717 TaxID=2704470 RepID=UPI001F5DE967|nr:hypothetical protein [Streptomyces sp. NP-1717]MCI3223406.1 hypothetical protein [Streptomyces sp. NP-1717]
MEQGAGRGGPVRDPVGADIRGGDPEHPVTNSTEGVEPGGDRAEGGHFPRVRRNAVMRLCCLLLEAALFPRKYRDEAIRADGGALSGRLLLR